MVNTRQALAQIGAGRFVVVNKHGRHLSHAREWKPLIEDGVFPAIVEDDAWGLSVWDGGRWRRFYAFGMAARPMRGDVLTVPHWTMC